jgi:hypothetical protein
MPSTQRIALLFRAVYRIWAHSDDVDGACEQLKALPAETFV